MARMTREERNKRQSDLRSQNSNLRRQDLESAIVSIFDDASRDYLTHAEILARYLKLIDGSGCVYSTKGLTMADSEYLRGVFYGLISYFYRTQLTWTHVLDGVRIKSGDANGRYREIDTKQSAHCYTRPDGTFVPWNLD